MVLRLLAKEEFAGSIPVSRSFLCPKTGDPSRATKKLKDALILKEVDYCASIFRPRSNSQKNLAKIEGMHLGMQVCKNIKKGAVFQSL